MRYRTKWCNLCSAQGGKVKKSLLFAIVIFASLGFAGASDCPVQVVKFKLLDIDVVGALAGADYHTTLEVKNTSTRTVTGLAWEVTSFDAVDKPHKMYDSWVWAVDLKPGKKHRRWLLLRQSAPELLVGSPQRGTVRLATVKFEDGTVDEVPCDLHYVKGK